MTVTETQLDVGVIPAPRSVRPISGGARFGKGCGVVVSDATGSSRLAAGLDQLRRDVASVKGSHDDSSRFTVQVRRRPGMFKNTEAYRLHVAEEGVEIEASGDAGCFYGMQTLRQMLLTARVRGDAGLPGVVIEDVPAYGWRGMLVDSARNYQPVEFLHRLIDELSLHKFNVMHWHLVDDQAWRLEVRAHPRLTAEAAYHSMGDRARGGWYTQEEIRQLIKYAEDRFVRIVPEIEMPGHCSSVLTVYPELSCRGDALVLPDRQGVFEDIYCAGNDSTFAFLTDVLEEVIDLFPDRYVHLGGDEAPKERWVACPRCQQRKMQLGLSDEGLLQAWFMRRVTGWLLERGRRPIVWDDMAVYDLDPKVVFQWWRNRTPDAWRWPSQWASRGHDSIFSPTTHCYLDYSLEKISVAQALSLKMTVDESLLPNDVARRHFLGGECNVWTEKVPWEHYMSQAFPRAAAIAQALWNPEASGSTSVFDERFP